MLINALTIRAMHLLQYLLIFVNVNLKSTTVHC